MRCFCELAYNGTRYVGWQKQPGQASLQETIEGAFSTILETSIEITGCGRTDAGVHARQYFLHFDFPFEGEGGFPEAFVSRLNKFLPQDIVVRRIFEVANDAHARYDAFLRSYEYKLCFNKNPFHPETIYHFPFAHKLDVQKVQEAANLLLGYDEFFPFCKTRSDVKTVECQLKRSKWIFDREKERMIYYISANRFLRGMVRLIVGMCLNVGLGKLSLEEVKLALDTTQRRLPKSWSVPPQGLFLTEVRYPFVE